ncbi:MAG: dioxygenase [Verrucomicrobia bacterium]|nr:MAG: dioxygenase [Verrucomicrobiota bacterium]
MSDSALGAPHLQGATRRNRGRNTLPSQKKAEKLCAGPRRKALLLPAPDRMVTSNGNGTGYAQTSFVHLGDSARLALMLEPSGRGPFRSQAQDVLSLLSNALQEQSRPMSVVNQTVFLRRAEDQKLCEHILSDFYGPHQPATNFLFQAPCSGAALAMEAWAIGGESVRVEHYSPQVLAVSYDRVRFIYCAGIKPASGLTSRKVYPGVLNALESLDHALRQAGSRFEHIVRLWYYLGGVTAPEGRLQRYFELNRARTDFYRNIPFGGAFVAKRNGHPLERGQLVRANRRSADILVRSKRGELKLARKSITRNTFEAGCGQECPRSASAIYPASTGIGMQGRQLIVSCIALETSRPDLVLVPLENPHQTPPCLYPPRYSPESPKFARATAMSLGDYVTTWISGTASVLNSESCHAGDIAKQTEQTIDNIERLIAPANFKQHGLLGAGATLRDLAKVRVYLKRQKDFSACQAICQRRFGNVPAIYAIADVCRPELLVEIEGVAFSKRLNR